MDKCWRLTSSTGVYLSPTEESKIRTLVQKYSPFPFRAIGEKTQKVKSWPFRGDIHPGGIFFYLFWPFVGQFLEQKINSPAEPIEIFRNHTFWNTFEPTGPKKVNFFLQLCNEKYSCLKDKYTPPTFRQNVTTRNIGAHENVLNCNLSSNHYLIAAYAASIRRCLVDASTTEQHEVGYNSSKSSD